MNVVRWSPFREFDNMFQALERPNTPVRRADWLPLVDVRETDQDYQIDVDEFKQLESSTLEPMVETLKDDGNREFRAGQEGEFAQKG